MGELRSIPNVGEATERDLKEMGYTNILSLKGKTGEELYAEECALHGDVDRCQLYLYRAVAYFVNAKNPDPKKCSWWYFKDEFVFPSPCGAVCVSCPQFPAACGGCRKTKGTAPRLQYAGAKTCPVYDCCVNGKKQKDCGGCENLPCEKFTKDPAISDEENAENLKRMLQNLRAPSRL